MSPQGKVSFATPLPRPPVPISAKRGRLFARVDAAALATGVELGAGAAASAPANEVAARAAADRMTSRRDSDIVSSSGNEICSFETASPALRFERRVVDPV
jgi:hypothetical protein